MTLYSDKRFGLIAFLLLFFFSDSYGQLGQSKRLLDQGMAPDSTYLLKYETRVQNLGSEAICDVEVADDITGNYASCNVIGTEVVNIYGSNGLDAWEPSDQFWDGGVDWDNNGAQTTFDIGASLDSICMAECGTGFCLSPGQEVVVYFVVKIDDDCFPAPESKITFDNTATSNGVFSGGGNTNEVSNDGRDPAAAGSVPTPADVGYTESVIGSAQTITDTLGNLISEPVLNPDGTYDFSYHITICNYDFVPNGGGAILSDVSYWMGIDHLSDLGMTVNQIDVLNPVGPLVPNPDYDALWPSEANALDDNGGDLAPGVCDTFEIRINAGPIPSANADNFVWWNGYSNGWDGSETIKDTSHDGDTENQYNPDPNPIECIGATDNCYASRIKFNANPAINLEKELLMAEAPLSGALGHIDLTWRLTVSNVGDVNLSNLSVLDSLVDHWSAACVVNVIGDSTKVVNIDATSPPQANSGFTGLSSGTGGTADLLSGTGSDLLGLNESFEIYFRVEVDAESCSDPLANYAKAYGDAPNGDSVEDPAFAEADLPSLGKIGDYIQNDDDNTSIAGVMVILYDSSGNPMDTTYTDNSGNYLFEGVFAGDYTVFVDSTNFDIGGPLEWLENSTDPDGVLDNTSQVTLTEGEENLEQDFGYSGTLVPINLISFKGFSKGCSNALTWETASEQQSAYFEIHKSHDGENFMFIGQVEAAGDSENTKYYNYGDQDPRARKVYYRLKQVDLDGESRFSPTILVHNSCYTEELWEIAIFPNPIKEKLQVQFTVDRPSEIEYRLYNIQGQLLLSKTVWLESGANQLVVPMQDLASGKYFIQVFNDHFIVKGISFLKLE